MTDQPKTNAQGAHDFVNDAIKNLTEVTGADVPVWQSDAMSRVVTAQALLAIACQLDRIANALEAQAQDGVKAYVNGRDFTAAVKRASDDRSGR